MISCYSLWPETLIGIVVDDWWSVSSASSARCYWESYLVALSENVTLRVLREEVIFCDTGCFCRLS